MKHHCTVREESLERSGLFLFGAGPCSVQAEKGVGMAREHFEKRLLRVLWEAGYLPGCLTVITPEQLVEVPGITVPGIRAVLRLQKELRRERAQWEQEVVS